MLKQMILLMGHRKERLTAHLMAENSACLMVQEMDFRTARLMVCLMAINLIQVVPKRELHTARSMVY